MKTKAEKPLAWSHKATPKAARAIKELASLKRQQFELSRRTAELQQIIIKEGGGMAHKMRAAIRHQNASAKMRLVRTKARDFVVLLDAAEYKTITADSQH